MRLVDSNLGWWLIKLNLTWCNESRSRRESLKDFPRITRVSRPNKGEALFVRLLPNIYVITHSFINFSAEICSSLIFHEPQTLNENSSREEYFERRLSQPEIRQWLTRVLVKMRNGFSNQIRWESSFNELKFPVWLRQDINLNFYQSSVCRYQIKSTKQKISSLARRRESQWRRSRRDREIEGEERLRRAEGRHRRWSSRAVNRIKSTENTQMLNAKRTKASSVTKKKKQKRKLSPRREKAQHTQVGQVECQAGLSLRD